MTVAEEGSVFVGPDLGEVFEPERAASPTAGFPPAVTPDPTLIWRRRLAASALAGSSRALALVLEQVSVVVDSRVSVLLLGPSGSGKSELARVLHESGRRRRGPFVTVDCTRLRPDRAEADLFGAMRGAYTGLDRPRDGLVAAADGGTLFLDEIGELPLDVQSQLLVFLQTRAFRPMGAERERTADVRVVAATSREANVLLEPLYWRLSGMVIPVPSLDERRGDIPAIAGALLARAAARDELAVLPLGRGAEDDLMRRAWPGNVRQLEQVLVRGLLWAHHDRSPEIRRAHLAERGPAPAAASLPEDLSTAERVFRRRHCEWVLERCRGNKSEAAERLGVSRSTLYEILA